MSGPRRSARIAEMSIKTPCNGCGSRLKQLTSICKTCNINVCSDFCASSFKTFCTACNTAKICKTCSETHCSGCADIFKMSIWSVDTFKWNYHDGTTYYGTKYFANLRDAATYKLFISGVIPGSVSKGFASVPEQVEPTDHIVYHILHNNLTNKENESCSCGWVPYKMCI